MKNAQALLIASALILAALLFTTEHREVRRVAMGGSALLFAGALGWMLYRSRP